jgi:multidrug efflux pump subunit AcrB
VASGRIPFTLLPEIDADTLRARVRFPQGVPPAVTEAAVRRLEEAARRLNDDPELLHHSAGPLVRCEYSVIGEWVDWIRRPGSHLCEVLIALAPAEERRLDSQVILAAWEKHTGVIDDAVSVTFNRAHRGPANKPLEMKLISDDLDQLHNTVEELSAKFAEFEGVSGIEHDLLPGRREVRVRLKPLARTVGLTADDLARQLRAGFYGGEAVRVQRGRDEVRVQVRYPDEQRRSIADIESMRVRGASGQEIPFREAAEYDLQRGYAPIHRQDGKRRAVVRADLDLRRANAEQILDELEADYLPRLRQKYPNVRFWPEGQHTQMLESLSSLSTGFIIAMIAVYAVLAAMLVSYVQPVVIMAAIPLGFAGAVLGHFLTGYDLTIMSVFGIVAMSGVVVNDSLVLLDQINSNVREGRPVFDAVLNAGTRRFRAVFLTTITTVAGLAPLMLERSTQAQSLIPMAISLVFGLLAATALTLVVVPALYLLMIDARRTVRWLRRGGPFPTPDAVVAPAPSLPPAE